MISAVWDGDWPITQPWGPTSLTVEPLYGTVHWHCGVDIGMPTGTRLYAARAGQVIACSLGVLGISLGGEIDWYIHIDRSLVAVGASVMAGQPIAYSGARVPSGGYLTGPHLHFEVNAAGLNVPPGLNPIPLLALVFGPGHLTLGGFGSMDDQAILDQFNFVSKKLSDIGGSLLAQGNAIVGLVKALPASGSVDLSAELAALATANGKLDQVLADEAALKAEADATKAKLDKDLA